MSVVAQAVYGAVHTATIQAWKITTLTPERQKLALAAVIGFGVLTVFILGGLIFLLIFLKLFPPPDMHVRVRAARTRHNHTQPPTTHMRASSANPSAPITENLGSASQYTTTMTPPVAENDTLLYTSDLIAGSAALGVAVLQAIAGAGITFVSLIAPLLIPLLALTVLFFVSLVFALYTDTIVGFAHSATVIFVRPLSDYAINLIAIIALMVYQAAYLIWVNINRSLRLLIVGPGLALIQCALPNVPLYLHDLGQILALFAEMFAYWFSSNPFFTDLPLVDFTHAVGNFVSDIYTNVVSCSCHVLDFLIGGIGKSFKEMSFARAVNNFVNAGIELVMEPIVRPIITQQGPSIDRTFNLTVAALIETGTWVQSIATYQFDIWIFDGNGTLVGEVNGSLPPPTDNLIYLVRFLRSQWATGTLRLLNWFLLIAWELLRIAFNIKTVFSANGAAIFKFDWTRTETLAVLDAAGSIIDVLPQCDNRPTFNDTVPFGDLVSIPRAAVWLIQAVVDVITGELYTTFYPPNEVLGFFLEQYLLAYGPTLQNLDAEIRKIGLAFGCTLAYLDKSIGISFDGLIQAVVIYVPRIPVQLLAALRYILETGNASVLDAVSVTPFEDALLQTARLGEIFYQFELGANSTTCPGRVTFFCSAGLFVEKLLSAAFRALTVSLRLIIHLIKVVVGGITTGTLGSIVAPDFQPLMDDLYAAACRLGTMLGTIIPMQVPCMQSQSGFCKVKEFPQQVDSTLNVCLGTFLCKVGNLLVVAIDIYFTIVHYVISFDFANTSLLVSAVKAVFNIIIFRLMSPFCPFGHFMDCLFDAMLGSAQTNDPSPASSFFCLITGAAVYLVQTVGDILISWLNWFIQLFILILNPGGSGDTAQAVVNLIVTFINNIGSTVGKLILAVIDLALSVFFAVIVGICYLINIPLFFIITTQCQNLNDSLQNLLGGSGLGFNAPQYINYKRDIVIMDTNQRCSLYSAHIFANNLFTVLDHDYPDLLNGKPSKINYTNTCRKRSIDPSSVIEMALLNTYGTGPSDPQQMPNYMATQVYWEPSSTCYMLMQLIAPLNTSDLGPAERVQFAECVRLKTLAVIMAATYKPLSWLPEDIFYNPWLRVSMLGIQLMRFSTVAIQWMMDHTLPPAMVLSADYQSRWTPYNLDASHYLILALAAQPDVAPALTPPAIVRVSLALQNLTLQSYLRANFPAYYNLNTTLGTDPLLDPYYSMYNFTFNFAMNTASGVYNQSVTVSSFNTSSVYFYGHDIYNRTELLAEFGPYVMSIVDLRMSSNGLFEMLSSLIMNLFNGAHAFATSAGFVPPPSTPLASSPYTAAGSGIYTATKRAIDATFSLYNGTARPLITLQNNTRSRLRSLYDSPAFQKQPSVLAGLVATTVSMAASVIDVDVNDTITPWCVAKATRLWNVSYEEARARLNPQQCMYIMNMTAPNATSSDESFLWSIFKPRNAGAIQKWNTVYNIGQSIMAGIWSTTYIFMGDGGTVVSRLTKVQKNQHPSWQEHIATVRARSYRTKNAHTEAWPSLEVWRKQNTGFFTEMRQHLQNMTRHQIQVRDALEWEFDEFLRPLRTKVIPRRMSRLNAPTIHQADLSLEPLFNNSLLLQRECGTDQQWLCDSCYFMDRLVGLIVDRVTGMIHYYTGYFIDVMQDSAAFVQYTLASNATVQIGRTRTFPPRWPALNDTTGNFLQLSVNETNNGLSLTLWLETILGGTFPALYSGGPCTQNVYNYTAERNLAASNGSAFVTLPHMEILAFIQITLGWDICALIDTATGVTLDRVENTGLYLAEHLVRCHYTYEIDCSLQQYSAVGGWIVTFTWVGGAMVVTLLALQPTPIGPLTMFMVAAGFLIVMPFFHAITTYGWSAWCSFVPPQCYVKDLWNFYAYTLNPKCSPILGAFVRNETWNLQTCYQTNQTWEFVNCQQLGFRTFIDVLTYWKLWLGTDFGLLEWLQPVLNILGSTTPTTDFAGWNTNEALHSNLGMCSIVVAVPYAYASLIFAILAGALVISFLPLVSSLGLGIIVFLANSLRFASHAIREIDSITTTHIL